MQHLYNPKPISSGISGNFRNFRQDLLSHCSRYTFLPSSDARGAGAASSFSVEFQENLLRLSIHAVFLILVPLTVFSFSSFHYVKLASSRSALNPVTREIVILAFQYSDFLETDSSHTSLLDENIRQVIRQLTTTNFRPPEISRGLPSARDERARARSHSVEPRWPTSWAIDKSELRSSLKIFRKGIEALRRLQDPPSTGTTPHTSPTVDPEPGNEESEVLESVELVENTELETSRSDTENTSEPLDKGKARERTVTTSPSSELEDRGVKSTTSPTSEALNSPRKDLPERRPETADDLVNKILFPPVRASFHKMSGPFSGYGNAGNRPFSQAGPSTQGGNPSNPPLPGHTGTAGPSQPPQGQQPLPPAPSGVDQNMWNTMLQAMQATLSNIQPAPGPAGPAGPQGIPGPAGQASAAGGSGGGFRASDLGFFHPDLEESYGTGDIVFSSKETIYREVYSFCRRVEDYAVIKGEDAVRTNLSTCFRGAALSWWLNTLSQDEKDAMMQLQTGLRRTLTRLQERFKISMSSALDHLTREIYTLNDAGSRRDPASYVQSVSKYAVQAGITDEHAQATWAWNHLDVDLQVSIPPPTSTTTLRQFTEELDNRKELWHRIHQQKESQHKDVRKEVRDREREREKERDRDRGDRAGKDRPAQKERQTESRWSATALRTSVSANASSSITGRGTIEPRSKKRTSSTQATVDDYGRKRSTKPSSRSVPEQTILCEPWNTSFLPSEEPVWLW